MQHRHGGSRDDRRPWMPGRRNFGRENGPVRKPYRPMRDCKAEEEEENRKKEILRRAGRLAAKYLVSKGLLPPSAIRPKWEDHSLRSFDYHGGIKKRDRDYGGRNHGDDYDEKRKRRRNDGCSLDWGRRRRRRVWGCYDDVEGGGDDFRHGCREKRRRWREKRVRREEVGDEHEWKVSYSRSRRDRHSKEERSEMNRVVVGSDDVEGGNAVNLDDRDDAESYESGEVREDDRQPFDGGYEVNDCDELSRETPANYAFDLNVAASECSLVSRGEVKMDVGGDLKGKGVVDSDSSMDISDEDLKGKFLNEDSYESDSDMDISDDEWKGESLCTEKEACVESNREVKCDTSDDLKRSSLCNESDVTESYYGGKDGDEVPKFCSLTSLPTKPRTSVGQGRSMVELLNAREAGVTIEVATEIPEVTAGDFMVSVSSESNLNQLNMSKDEQLVASSIMPVQQVDESGDQQLELSWKPAYLEASGQKVTVNKEIQLLGQPLKSERFFTDEETVTMHANDEEESVQENSVTQFNPEIKMKKEVEVLEPKVYKVCDLNLTPETTEFEDELVFDHLHAPAPAVEADRVLTVGYGPEMGNMPSNSDGYYGLSMGKMVPVIDLQDDSSAESNAFDSSTPKSETLQSSLAKVGGSGDRQVAYNGYSPAIPVFNRTDISVISYSFTPSDLNIQWTGAGIPGAEVLGSMGTT